MAVITTTATLVTLLFGLGALVSDADSYVLPIEARINLALALVLFVASGLAALLTNLPVPSVIVDPDTLLSAVAGRWDDASADADRFIAEMHARLTVGTDRVNTLKSWVALVAMILELAGIVAVAGAVGAVLTGRT